LKILIASDYCGVSTGYGRVGCELARAILDAGHEVVYLGWSYDGGSHNFPFQVIQPTKEDYFGANILTQIIMEHEPDVFLSLGDPWMFEQYAALPVINDIYWWGYFPIDGLPIPRNWHGMIDKMDRIMVISKFAQQSIKEILPQREVSLLYHGVDTNSFYPLSTEERDIIRKQNNLHDKFAVLCVARNQPRKNIPVLIKSFAKFAKDKDDVRLLLRMNNQDAGWLISDLLERFKILDKSYIIEADPRVGVPIQALNQIYNTGDLFVLPTMGEGFGIPLLESQAAGTPILATDCSCIPELIHSPKQKIQTLEQIISNRNIQQAYADPKDLISKLNYFYNNRKVLGDIRQKGIDFAKTMTWDIIRGQFMDYLAQVEEELKNKKKSNVTFSRV